MGVTAAIIAGVGAVGGTTASVVNAQRSRREMEDARKDQEAKQAALLKKQKEDEARANRLEEQKNLLASRRSDYTSQASGARSTILTSPLGDVSTPQTTTKTLLGS